MSIRAAAVNGEFAFRIDPDTREAVPLEMADLASFGFWERRDLQEWIIKQPEIIEPDLLLVATEFDRWQARDHAVADRLDLLFLDSDGSLLVAELKRGEAPDTTELQAVKYAAFCSQLTVPEIVEEYARTHSVDPDQALSEIRDHAPALADRELGPVRIRLVAEAFRPSVTHVVMWLREHAIDVGCIQITTRRHPDGSAVISSRRLLPPPVAEDYLVQRRQREATEIAREATTRSRNSVTILQEAGALEPGVILELRTSRMGDAEQALRDRIKQEPLFGEAEWTGLSLNQALRWRYDGALYACTPLVLKLIEDVGYFKKAIAGPQCWVLPDGRTLAELAAEIEPQREPTASATPALSLRDLIGADVIKPGTPVSAKRPDLPGEGVIQEDGTILIDGRSFTPTAASNHVGGYGSGWDYWTVESSPGTQKSLGTIRREFVEQDVDDT